MTLRFIPLFLVVGALVGCGRAENYNSCILSGLANTNLPRAVDEMKAACERQFTQRLPRRYLKNLEVHVYVSGATSLSGSHDGLVAEVLVDVPSTSWQIKTVTVRTFRSDQQSVRSGTFTGESCDWACEIPLDETMFPNDALAQTKAVVASATGVYVGPPKSILQRLRDWLEL